MPRQKKPAGGSQVVDGDRMFAARGRAKLNQFEAAQKVRDLTKDWKTGQVRINAIDVSQLESGKHGDVGCSRIKAFALAYGCSTDYLLGLPVKK